MIVKSQGYMFVSLKSVGEEKYKPQTGKPSYFPKRIGLKWPKKNRVEEKLSSRG